MIDCVFCRIIARQTAADIEYEDAHVMAFKDIYPKALVHILIVPKRHIDARGWFSEIFQDKRLRDHGITCRFCQDNLSSSNRACSLSTRPARRGRVRCRDRPG